MRELEDAAAAAAAVAAENGDQLGEMKRKDGWRERGREGGWEGGREEEKAGGSDPFTQCGRVARAFGYFGTITEFTESLIL